jgi:hypothetical protein
MQPWEGFPKYAIEITQSTTHRDLSKNLFIPKFSDNQAGFSTLEKTDFLLSLTKERMVKRKKQI